MGLFNNAILGIIGFLLSAYSVYVEHKVVEQNESPDGEEFQALCDIEVYYILYSCLFLPIGIMYYVSYAMFCYLTLIIFAIFKFDHVLILLGDWSKLQVRKK